jgi:hypothetical protein
MNDHLGSSTNRPESLSAFRAALSDLSAAFNEAVRVWKRRRWLRNYRASINDPFTN